jgi:hypothetical protein
VSCRSRRKSPPLVIKALGNSGIPGSEGTELCATRNVMCTASCSSRFDIEKRALGLEAVSPSLRTTVTVSFPRVKRPGLGVDHPRPSSAEVKERVEIYLFSPSGASWPVLRGNFVSQKGTN